MSGFHVLVTVHIFCVAEYIFIENVSLNFITVYCFKLLSLLFLGTALMLSSFL